MPQKGWWRLEQKIRRLCAALRCSLLLSSSPLPGRATEVRLLDRGIVAGGWVAVCARLESGGYGKGNGFRAAISVVSEFERRGLKSLCEAPSWT